MAHNDVEIQSRRDRAGWIGPQIVDILVQAGYPRGPAQEIARNYSLPRDLVFNPDGTPRDPAEVDVPGILASFERAVQSLALNGEIPPGLPVGLSTILTNLGPPPTTADQPPPTPTGEDATKPQPPGLPRGSQRVAGGWDVDGDGVADVDDLGHPLVGTKPPSRQMGGPPLFDRSRFVPEFPVFPPPAGTQGDPPNDTPAFDPPANDPPAFVAPPLTGPAPNVLTTAERFVANGGELDSFGNPIPGTEQIGPSGGGGGAGKNVADSFGPIMDFIGKLFGPSGGLGIGAGGGPGADLLNAIQSQGLAAQRDLSGQQDEQVGALKRDFSRRGVLNSGFARDAQTDLFSDFNRARGAINANTTSALAQAQQQGSNQQLGQSRFNFDLIQALPGLLGQFGGLFGR